MKKTEHQEQVIVFNWIRLNRKLYPVLETIYAIPNGGHRHIGVARKLKAEGVKSGVWDIFVMSPKFDKGYIIYCGLYIEMKIKPNKLTDNQLKFKKNGEKYYNFEICYSATAAIKSIKNYLELK